jgi:hypothetical protein
MVLAAALYFHAVLAVSINDITSGKYNDQNVRDVPGVITGKFSRHDLISVRSTTPELSRNSSNSVFIIGDGIASNVTVGDSIVFDAKVTWVYYGALDSGSVQNIRIIATNISAEPVLVGPGGRIPVFNSSLYWVDFWETLNAELVLIPNTTFLAYEKFISSGIGETAIMVRGNWPYRGVNNRGGLTMINEGETQSLSRDC